MKRTATNALRGLWDVTKDAAQFWCLVLFCAFIGLCIGGGVAFVLYQLLKYAEKVTR